MIERDDEEEIQYLRQCCAQHEEEIRSLRQCCAQRGAQLRVFFRRGEHIGEHSVCRVRFAQRCLVRPL